MLFLNLDVEGNNLLTLGVAVGDDNCDCRIGLGVNPCVGLRMSSRSLCLAFLSLFVLMFVCAG